ncbi:helix-turn-helix transcriptional regulator [uncultured Candidatus Puniceispirillum sp.]|uniref:helix-turn-helix domain-containing protein n=1 Tax=uncultured Candidatus Puniceispirillum sp. TaxID=1985115 RepID=UPI0032B1E501
MNFVSNGIQNTVDKIINSFCFSYDLHEMTFRKELAQFVASKDMNAHEDDDEAMLEAVWGVIAAKDKDYKFAISAGSMMATAPPSPLNFMKNYAPDLRSVFFRVPCFTKLLPAADIKFKETVDTVSLHIKSHDPGYGSSLQIAFYFTFLIRMARAQTSEPFIILKLELDKKYETCEKLSEFMGCSIERGNACSIHVSKSDAMIPFVGADRIMWMEAASELNRRLLGDKDLSLYEQVNDILMEDLPFGSVTIDHVIERLGVGKRTFQRRLKQDGISFRQILAETRFKLATKFLRQGKMSKTEIAYQLGYRDANSFYRVHKEWTKSGQADD